MLLRRILWPAASAIAGLLAFGIAVLALTFLWLRAFQLRVSGGTLVYRMLFSAAPAGEASFRVTTVASWWIDDEETCERISMSTKAVTIGYASPGDVHSALEGAFQKSLQLPRDALTRKSRIMPRPRDHEGRYIVSEFERAQRLPT